VDLASFPATGEPAVDRCRAVIAGSRPAARAACNAGSDRHWLCPAGIAVRLRALDECEVMSRGAGAASAAMLYLMGLGYSDVPFRAAARGDCERHYFFQEGSSICVYEDAHFDRVMARYPDSPWAQMAAFQVAERTYRYYECEGSATCAAENRIAGFIEYLERDPRSTYATLATGRVVEALTALAYPGNVGASSHNETGRLREDLDRLSRIARKLTAANREKLSSSLSMARKVVDQIERDRRTGDSK
jgi:hypothetical protein